jgi:hypothetical protein
MLHPELTNLSGFGVSTVCCASPKLEGVGGVTSEELINCVIEIENKGNKGSNPDEIKSTQSPGGT